MVLRTVELKRDAVEPSVLTELARLVNTADPLQRPEDPPVTEQLIYDRLAPGGQTYEFRHYATFDPSGKALAAATAEGALTGQNLDYCEVGVLADPEHGRQGIANALVDHALAEALAAGRTKTWAWGVLSPASSAFWNKRGLELGYEERVSRCVLADVDDSLMAGWIESASARAAGYHLERWVGPCPDDLVANFAIVKEAMDDAPTDDLVYERELWDIDRIRDYEAAVNGRGYDTMTLMAVETATGDVAAYTSVRIQRARPAVSDQNDTVTLASHRNRGLGRWIKAEMWRWLRADRSDVVSLDTGNAESNDAMLAINVAMGFRPTSTIGVWHRPGS